MSDGEAGMHKTFVEKRNNRHTERKPVIVKTRRMTQICSKGVRKILQGQVTVLIKYGDSHNPQAGGP